MLHDASTLKTWCKETRHDNRPRSPFEPTSNDLYVAPCLPSIPFNFSTLVTDNLEFDALSDCFQYQGFGQGVPITSKMMYECEYPLAIELLPNVLDRNGSFSSSGSSSSSSFFSSSSPFHRLVGDQAANKHKGHFRCSIRSRAALTALSHCPFDFRLHHLSFVVRLHRPPPSLCLFPPFLRFVLLVPVNLGSMSLVSHGFPLQSMPGLVAAAKNCRPSPPCGKCRFASQAIGTCFPSLASITSLDLSRFECDDLANSVGRVNHMPCRWISPCA